MTYLFHAHRDDVGVKKSSNWNKPHTEWKQAALYREPTVPDSNRGPPETYPILPITLDSHSTGLSLTTSMPLTAKASKALGQITIKKAQSLTNLEKKSGTSQLWAQWPPIS